MSNTSNPARIGAFVLGALALLVVGVALFGGTELFGKKSYFVTYFPGSVKGLRVGSNVTFRGVRVGYVTDIEVVTAKDTEQFDIPVTYQLLPESFKVVEDGNIRTMAESPRQLSLLIEQGLRARLETESFVTGQLVIQLDFLQDQPAVFRGKNQRYPEIPAAPSSIQEVLAGLERFWTSLAGKIDEDQVLNDIQGILSGLNRLANSPDLAATLAGMEKLANSADTQALPADVRSAVKSLTVTLDDTRRVVGQLDKDIEPLTSNARQALVSLNEALQEATKVLRAADFQLGQDGASRNQLDRTLEEFERSARSLRILIEYLDQQPQSIIRGKPKQKENR
jgi:paraquat-inducible protein B